MINILKTLKTFKLLTLFALILFSFLSFFYIANGATTAGKKTSTVEYTYVLETFYFDSNAAAKIKAKNHCEKYVTRINLIFGNNIYKGYEEKSENGFNKDCEDTWALWGNNFYQTAYYIKSKGADPSIIKNVKDLNSNIDEDKLFRELINNEYYKGNADTERNTLITEYFNFTKSEDVESSQKECTDFLARIVTSKYEPYILDNYRCMGIYDSGVSGTNQKGIFVIAYSSTGYITRDNNEEKEDNDEEKDINKNFTKKFYYTYDSNSPEDNDEEKEKARKACVEEIKEVNNYIKITKSCYPGYEVVDKEVFASYLTFDYFIAFDYFRESGGQYDLDDIREKEKKNAEINEEAIKNNTNRHNEIEAIDSNPLFETEIERICNEKRDYGIIDYSGLNCEDEESGLNAIFTLLQKGANFVLQAAFMIVVIMFLMTGFKLLTANGNTTKLTDARTSLINIAIGLLLISSAWLIVDWTFSIFQIDESHNFTSTESSEIKID